VVRSILKTANLEELSKKKVREMVAARFPDLNLESQKVRVAGRLLVILPHRPVSVASPCPFQALINQEVDAFVQQLESED
jgi:hypothetical protein